MEGYRSHDLLIAYEEGRYDPGQMQVALWTDDTAMTVATAQSLVSCGGIDGEDLAKRFLVWYRTSGRGIGRAALRAMERLLNRVPWNEAGETGQWAAGNGVAMRIAPVGLFHAPSLEGLAEDVNTCAVITHRNEEAISAALVVAWVVAQAAAGVLKLERLTTDLIKHIPPCKTLEAVSRAQEMAEDGVRPTKALPELGLGGSAAETVATALYCWLRSPDDIMDTLVTAVLGAGDADTRGAIAGSIAGAYLGAGALPPRFTRHLDGYHALNHLADRLYDTTMQAWEARKA
jgi:ADP-ribosyl-[dinitrogen reductase] hydrolase